MQTRAQARKEAQEDFHSSQSSPLASLPSYTRPASATATTAPRSPTKALLQLPVEKLQPFSTLDVKKWLRRFTVLSSALGVDPALAIACHVHPAILDALLDRFPALASTRFKTISDFIVSTFGFHRDKATVRRQLQTRRQKPAEPVGAFAVDVTALVAELDEQVDDYVELFLSGLRDDIAILLGITTPSSFADAVALAQKAEARLAARRGVPAQQRQQHDAAAVYSSSPSSRQPPPRRPYQGNQSQRDDNPRVLRCFYCKKPGHVIRDCMKRKAAEQRRNAPQRGYRRGVHAVEAEDTEAPHPDEEVCAAQASGAVSLRIPIKVNGAPMDALIDTGASVTLVSSDTYRAARDGPLMPSTTVLRTADQGVLKVLGVADFAFSIGSTQLRHSAIVVDRLAHAVLLGADILSTMRALVDVAHRRLILPEGNLVPAWANAVGMDDSPAKTAVSSLSSAQQRQLQQLLQDFKDAFATPGQPLTRARLPAMRIETGETRPVSRRPYRLSHHESQEVERIVKDHIAAGIVRPSFSPWASPVILIKKKTGEYRLVVDYRRLNSVTVPDAYPLPRLDDTLEAMAGAQWFSSLDLASAYHQVPLDPEDQSKTAFVTKSGVFQFTVVPFGLRNAPGHFQRCIDTVLRDVSGVSMYLDDIVIFSATFDGHLATLRTVFKRLRDVNLQLRRDKCFFLRDELDYLGHLVSKHGVQPNPDKVNAIAKMPAPKDVRELRTFLGMAGFYRRFVAKFAEIGAPLYALLRDGVEFKFDEPQLTAFRRLKAALASSPVLVYPDFTRPFTLATDASGVGLGAVLQQRQDDGKLRPIAFVSRVLNKAERKYSVTEQECLALVWAIKKLRPYLHGKPFTAVTDHRALQWLRNLKDPTGRLGRWALALQDMDFEVVHKPGTENVVADALSRLVAPVQHDSDDDNNEEDPLLGNGEESRVVPVGMTTATFSEEQAKDPFCIAVTAYLRDGTVPDFNDAFGMPEARFWKQADDFCIGTTSGLLLAKDKIVVPKTLRKRVFLKVHAHPASGHLGVQRTHDRAAQRFFWPGMYTNIKTWTLQCGSCLRAKDSAPRSLPLGAVVAAHPLDIVAMDVLGPLPETDAGNKYIIVACDLFTRFMVTAALPDQKTPRVVDFVINKVVATLGTPRQLLTDQGPNFRSNDAKALYQALGSKKIWTTPYHPQTNGTVERFNRTLTRMLAAFVEANQRDWDTYLGLVTLAYNTTFHAAIGNTPHFLVFGRDPVDPGLPQEQDTAAPGDQAHEVARATDVLAGAHELVRDFIGQRQDAREAANADKPDPPAFNVNDRVLLHTPRVKRGTTSKLARLWRGPYLVTKKLSQYNYRIVPEQGGPAQVVHIARLKPYTAEEDSTPPDALEDPVEPDVLLD